MGRKIASKESFRSGSVAEGKGEEIVRPLPASNQLYTKSCARCGGLLVHEWYYDSSNTGGHNVEPLRCVQCGHRIDPVILQNQTRPSLGTQRVRPKRHTDPVKTVMVSGVA